MGPFMEAKCYANDRLDSIIFSFFDGLKKYSVELNIQNLGNNIMEACNHRTLNTINFLSLCAQEMMVYVYRN